MRGHIAPVVGHLASRAKSLDVVNGAIDGGKGYLRKSDGLTSVGDDFLADAFIAARQADPTVKLYHNDYSLERPAKREKSYA